MKKAIRIINPDPNDPVVETSFYRYDVSLHGRDNIFRYDSPHVDHNKEHHVHRYDVKADDRAGRVSYIWNDNDRPTLGEAIAEAESWYSRTSNG